MRNRTKGILAIAIVVAVAMIAALAYLGYSLTQPRKIVWDLRKGPLTQETLGWHPRDRFDIGFSIAGDIDFTLWKSDGSVFHQRCWEIGVERHALHPEDHRVFFEYAHFARDVTVEQGLEIAVKVLNEWGGGLRESFEPLPRGDLTIDQFRQAMRDDKYYETSWGIQGHHGGSVRLSFTGTEPRSAGLKRTCTLTFLPG